MKKSVFIVFLLLISVFIITSCEFLSALGKKILPDTDMGDDVKIIFLHHSTGAGVYNAGVAAWFDNYNITNSKNYQITERAYPKNSPYGWHNYPYDYWNIWVNHAGPYQYQQEDTLEILTQNYDVIIWKHCYPVSEIINSGTPDVESSTKTIENYKLQYNALKAKMKTFPETRFIVWTGAVHVQGNTHIDEAKAQRMNTFVNWVKNEWDEDGDNIFIWDFYELETDGESLYLKNEYAQSNTNSHPNNAFNNRVAPLFSQRVVNVIQGKGNTTSLTGE